MDKNGRGEAHKYGISAMRPSNPKGESEKARNVDSKIAIRKWKAREDQHLGGIEVRSHGAHDTGNLHP